MSRVIAVVSKLKFIAKTTSAPPTTGYPGAAGLVRGLRSVSFSGKAFGICEVVGSAIGAP